MADLSRTHIVKALFTPSWSEVTITILLSIATVLMVVVPQLYERSSYSAYLNLDTASQTDVYQNISNVTQAINSSTFASTVAVFMFWAFIGLVVFFLVDTLLRSLESMTSFLDAIHLSRRNRAHLEVEGLTRLGIRVAAAAGLYLLYQAFITRLLPAALLLSHRSLDAGRLSAVLYMVGSMVLLTLTIHVAVILLRLLFLRVRVFGSNPLDA